MNLLDELKESLGLTLLFIAHDLSMVRYVSDRMAVMYLGSLVEIGPADEVYFRPQHPYTQSLVASNPEPDPRAERERATIPIKGEIPSPVNVAAGLPIREALPEGDGRLPQRDSRAARDRRRARRASRRMPPVRDGVRHGVRHRSGAPE